MGVPGPLEPRAPLAAVVKARYTRRVMGELEHVGGPLSWVAVTHVGEAAHTEYAHIHLLTPIDTRFNREELGTLRTLAKRIWQERRGGEESL